jgi:hypothetical protein
MVRRNELACRDEWSRSLWQPREAPQSNGDRPFQRPTSGPLPPALAGNLRSVLNHETAQAASAQGEDVLLSEARIVSEAHETWEPQPRPFPVGNFDPRTAIFRAREAYKERARAKANADRQSAGAEAIVGTATAEDFAFASVQDPIAEPQAFPPRETGGEDTDGELQVPSPEIQSLSNDSIQVETAKARAQLPANGAATSGQGQEGSPPTAFEPILEEALTDWRSSPSRDERTKPLAPGRQASDDADVTTRHDEEDEREALPDWYRSDLPRICRTCREFRPSADSQRGWCANSWAFTHRRLVVEDDPAPCRSAIGDWWLAVDDVWLVAADVSSHGRATPLLDRLTAKAERERRRS